ncbi:DUF924 family protein [Poseidonocella sedimentorum]|uniref:Uncharacterized conserved protein, DUF924 family n=1 Tax=Poseidonocella sedimentorum TaxID=871652 RepID=A0A1I6DZ44_9RHOB|nr:DUF924 family protein [Poseidonocella sedimentorum]SFR10667.1 Uncharacterized conserved protein, DUF924 family [Poseidonocella sedimentorum]
MAKPEEVLKFWLDEIEPKDWYIPPEGFDETVRTRFADTWAEACDGAYGMWLTYPSGALAYIILLDQFPRNMFRGTARSFETDKYALAAAKIAISRGWDLKIDEPARQFFYLPLMHSESQSDQDRCVRLIMERMPIGGPNQLLHARAHREVIRRFGRFPYRNAALGRKTTPQEERYLGEGGYASTLRALEATVAG